MRRCRLLQDRRGATAVEFALVVVPLLMLLIGTIALGARLWAWQVLTAAAADAARCAGIDAASCANVATSAAATRTYAVSAAATRGFTGLATGDVTVSTGTTARAACNGISASVVYVSLSYTYGSWTSVVPLPATITGSACFPLASS